MSWDLSVKIKIDMDHMSHKFLRKIMFSCTLIGLILSTACGIPPAQTLTATPIPSETPMPTLTPTPIVAPEGWQLVWHDEFDGTKIDPKNWTYDLGAGGWGNGEMENYTSRPENARVENGMLVIEARAEKYNESYYTSARLKTKGLQNFQYGRIEARIKVPAGKGLWPAFWMLGSSFATGTKWPLCGEIDIMEYIGREPDLIMGTLHGPGYSGAVGIGKWNRQSFNIADDFHTYAIEWEEGQISWFFDGQQYFTVKKADVGDREWVFDAPFFIILNLAVGGQLPGLVGLDVKFPVQMYVDYVRVYQQLP
jgi:beta-glucanase (GH16 family)